MSAGSAPRWVGDRALLREFPGELAAANRSARALGRTLGERSFPEVEDLIPAARSLLVLLRPGLPSSGELASALEVEVAPDEGFAAPDARDHEIPVVYGGEAGPDLARIASVHGLSQEELASVHASVVYTVGFLGFAPGFAYLFGLPAKLAAPRLATPRTKVPAGSVAIGGEFTGIYPRATPGGWRIIGRAEVALFDAALDPPARLLPGDLVKLVPR